jgi:hypothetical protein
MTIEQLIQLAQARRMYLSTQLESVTAIGDVSSMERITKELEDTEQTIEKLKLLM